MFTEQPPLMSDASNCLLVCFVAHWKYDTSQVLPATDSHIKICNGTKTVHSFSVTNSKFKGISFIFQISTGTNQFPFFCDFRLLIYIYRVRRKFCSNLFLQIPGQTANMNSLKKYARKTYSPQTKTNFFHFLRISLAPAFSRHNAARTNC